MSNQTTAKIDQNDKNVWGLYNETTGLVESARVDPIFDYLEIYGAGTSSTNPTAVDRAKIDGNSRNTISAYNETTGLIEAVRCDSNGYMLVLPV